MMKLSCMMVASLALLFTLPTNSYAVVADCVYAHNCKEDMPKFTIIFKIGEEVKTDCLYENGKTMVYDTFDGMVVDFDAPEHQVVVTDKVSRCSMDTQYAIALASEFLEDTLHTRYSIIQKRVKPIPRLIKHDIK